LQEQQAPELPISQSQSHCTKILEKKSTELTALLFVTPSLEENSAGAFILTPSRAPLVSS